jgi:hypothetical protein
VRTDFSGGTTSVAGTFVGTTAIVGASVTGTTGGASVATVVGVVVVAHADNITLAMIKHENKIFVRRISFSSIILLNVILIFYYIQAKVYSSSVISILSLPPPSNGSELLIYINR